jgi:AraC-like DNA-binding protein
MQEEPLEYTERHYFTPTPLEKSGPIWPVRLGRNIAKRNYHAGPKVTTYFSLHFVDKGEGSFIQSNQKHSLRQGDAFCLFPSIPHEYYTSKESPLHMTWIAVDGIQAARVLERAGLSPSTPYRRAALEPSIASLLNRFFEVVHETDSTYGDMARLGMLYQMFDALSLKGNESKPASGDAQINSWLQKGLDYLEMHYADGIRIEKVAEFIGVDRGYFSRKFQEAYGMTPIKYLQLLKLKEAKRMLESTEYKLSEIALSVGYPDQFSFSKSFKKHFNVSPISIRREQAPNVHD